MDDLKDRIANYVDSWGASDVASVLLSDCQKRITELESAEELLRLIQEMHSLGVVQMLIADWFAKKATTVLE